MIVSTASLRKAAEQIREDTFRVGYAPAVTAIESILREHLKVYEWTSVNDGYPDLRKPVHFIFRGKVYSGTYEVEHSTWEEPHYTAYYWDTTDKAAGIEEHEYDRVTHWMYQIPLPEELKNKHPQFQPGDRVLVNDPDLSPDNFMARVDRVEPDHILVVDQENNGFRLEPDRLTLDL
jgi:hypothetical protein